MTEDELLRLQGVARALAWKWGYGDLADDFAQDFIVQALEGQGNVMWGLCNFLRREYGNKRTHSGRIQMLERHSKLSLDSPAGGDDNPCLHETLRGPEPDPAPPGSGWRNRLALTGRTAAIAGMILDDGATERDIAAFYDVTESRIAQLFAPVKRQVEAAAIIDETWDAYKDDPDYSKLRVDWITL